MNLVSASASDIALRSVALIANGERLSFDQVIAPAALNHEAAVEPPACRVPGPEGFHATALWLRSAYADIEHRINHVVETGDLVAIDTTMSGRHVGPFLVYNAAGAIESAWAPTGKHFAARQSHWLRVRDGQVTEHWAVRDDLGQGIQLGWIPPSPVYLVRCALAKRQALRTSRR